MVVNESVFLQKEAFNKRFLKILLRITNKKDLNDKIFTRYNQSLSRELPSFLALFTYYKEVKIK